MYIPKVIRLVPNLCIQIHIVFLFQRTKFQDLKDVKLNEIRSEPNYVYRETCEFFYYNYMNENDDVPNHSKINQIISNRKRQEKIEILYILIVMLLQLHVLKLA